MHMYNIFMIFLSYPRLVLSLIMAPCLTSRIGGTCPYPAITEGRARGQEGTVSINQDVIF